MRTKVNPIKYTHLSPNNEPQCRQYVKLEPYIYTFHFIYFVFKFQQNALYTHTNSAAQLDAKKASLTVTTFVAPKWYTEMKLNQIDPQTSEFICISESWLISNDLVWSLSEGNCRQLESNYLKKNVDRKHWLKLDGFRCRGWILRWWWDGG